MLTLQRIRLSAINKQDPTFIQLYEIFSKTLKASMSYKEFCVYYLYHQPHVLDITFLLDGNETVGFISAAFYRHRLNGGTYTICRGAIGILPAYRCGSLTGWQLCLKYITYKIRNPFENVYLTAFITNPIMYSMICKYVGKVYPKQGIAVPSAVHQLKEDMIALYKLQKKEIAPFVVKVHFHVPLSEWDLQKIHTSRDKDIRFYLSMTSSLQDQASLFTMVPVNWNNVFLTAFTALIARPVQKFIKKTIFKQRRTGVPQITGGISMKSYVK